MSPETRAFLHSVRDAEDPTPEDERRVLTAVSAAVAAGAALGVAGATAKNAHFIGSFSISGLKLAGVLLCLAAAGWLAQSRLGTATTTSASPATLSQSDQRAPERAAVAPTAPTAPTAPSTLEARALPIASTPPRLPSPPERPASLRREIALLADVQAALERGDGAGALGRLDQHVTLDRQFSAERHAARILALCLLGRKDEARRSAAGFLRQHPASVQRGAVERSCAGTKPGDGG